MILNMILIFLLVKVLVLGHHVELVLLDNIFFRKTFARDLNEANKGF